MLRITLHYDTNRLTFQLEGKLVGPWVQELADCWQRSIENLRRPALCFDLTAVTFVDPAGKEFLAAMHTLGAEFVACGCLMRAVVAEITNAPMAGCGSKNEGQSNGGAT
jgi:anti-anti-sigma regulatory factor